MQQKRKTLGWYFFDWASQPYSVLILTFIFAPYISSLIGDGSKAQAIWGFGVGAAGIIVAIFAPILGAMADTGGTRMRWLWLFSAMYIFGSCGLWWAVPGDFNLTLILVLFAIGLIGVEFATIFTNAYLPELGPKEKLGKISGNGWSFGYVGGLFALIIVLALFAEGENGLTMLNISPLFGLDPELREGTRIVGPLTAVWFAVFMVPFFLWVRDPTPTKREQGAVKIALTQLLGTIKSLPKSPSLFAYLGSSMFYRDALNGMYTFGGIYAAGVLEWSVVDVGTFGILAIVSGAIFAWLGGLADSRFGPLPVIKCGVFALCLIAISVVFVSRESVFGIAVEPASNLPDLVFYILGAGIGAAGGALQAASRTMLVRQANPERMTEAFGLYAFAGKATSFIAPLSIGIATTITGSQQLGVTPLIVLFVLGWILLFWVKPDRKITLQ